MTFCHLFIIINALFPQYRSHHPCKEYEIGKTGYCNPVGLMNSDAFQVGQFTLYRWNDGTSQNHHN
jgi:hypothetical protein